MGIEGACSEMRGRFKQEGALSQRVDFTKLHPNKTNKEFLTGSLNAGCYFPKIILDAIRSVGCTVHQ